VLIAINSLFLIVQKRTGTYIPSDYYGIKARLYRRAFISLVLAVLLAGYTLLAELLFGGTGLQLVAFDGGLWVDRIGVFFAAGQDSADYDGGSKNKRYGLLHDVSLPMLSIGTPDSSAPHIIRLVQKKEQPHCQPKLTGAGVR
jgi:hypothetical protein